MHFRVEHFDDYSTQHGFQRAGLKFFYEETPYANL